MKIHRPDQSTANLGLFGNCWDPSRSWCPTSGRSSGKQSLDTEWDNSLFPATGWNWRRENLPIPCLWSWERELWYWRLLAAWIGPSLWWSLCCLTNKVNLGSMNRLVAIRFVYCIAQWYNTQKINLDQYVEHASTIIVKTINRSCYTSEQNAIQGRLNT